MRKRSIVVAVFFVLFIIVGACLWPSLRKDHQSAVALPEIERITQNGGGVVYVDRRGPDFSLSYIDYEPDGEMDRIESRQQDQVSQNPAMTFKIVETKDEADEKNFQNLRNGGFSATYWFGRSSAEVWNLQDLYKEVREEYRRRHFGMNLPENADPSTRIRSESIRLFQNLLAEFRSQDNRVHRARTEKASEIVRYRTYLAFLKMRRVYRGQLNEWERRFLFRTVQNLPRGIKFNSGPEVTEILGLPLTGQDPRGDFEWFLRLSYMETDYMSSWSIFQEPAELERIQNQYNSELEAKGLKVMSE